MCEEVSEDETFQFGSGAPERSTRAFIYPAGIYGKVDLVRMSMVEGGALNCPGLAGLSELARWQVCFNFAAKSLEILGQRHSMVLLQTRHPALYPLNFPQR